MSQHSKTWIQTHSGKAFDLAAPTPDMVDPRDIAWALANICRYTGHTPYFYSVAQHCYYAAVYLAREYRLPLDHQLVQAGLLHDAAEAYVCDVSAPLKRVMRTVTVNMEPIPRGCTPLEPPPSAYDLIEGAVHEAVRERFGIPREVWHDPRVKEADNRVYAREREVLFPSEAARPWSTGFAPAELDITKWGSVAAERYLWIMQDCGLVAAP